MKTIKLLLIILLVSCFGYGQTVLTAGDIAFIGTNADGTVDEVAFVLLKDVDASTTIIFTDRGWNDATGFSSFAGDGDLTWTSGSPMTAGTIITIGLSGNLSLGAAYATIGDQLFAIQGSIASPTFIAGLQYNDAPGTDANWDGAATSNSTSALPNALTTGDTAVRLAPEQDNWQFDCSTVGAINDTPFNIRAIIHNTANWLSDNGTPYSPAAQAGCSITVTAAADTVDPVITCAPTPADITAGTDGLAAIPDLVAGTTATDDVSAPGDIVITQSPTAGTMVGAGVHMVTLTAMDEAGNSDSCVINVTVLEPPSTVLSAGDIAFVAFNLDGDDSFAFVLLQDVIAGTNIRFTDCGVANPNTITCLAGDGTATWYASSAMTAGNVVILPGSFLGGSVLSSAGDQLFAYQGTEGAPVFLAGIHSNIESGVTNDTDWDGDVTMNDRSALPDQLINGVNALRVHLSEVESDNWIYNCADPITEGTPAQIAATINTLANWINDDTTPYDVTTWGCSFFVDLTGDTTDPVISDCGPTPADITADTLGNATVPDLTAAVVATDETTLVGDLVITQSPVAGTTITAGVTVVTLFVADEAGNTASCTINVTVVNIVATTLAAGDIAFVMINQDAPDAVSFVLLKDILAGTMINFTDCGVNNPNTIACLGANDTTNTWFSPTDMSAGSIVTLDASFIGSLGSIGDQVFAYQGDASSPTYIAGIHTSVVTGTNNADWDGSNTSGATSALPDQLTNGVNAIRLHDSESEVDNWIFDCSLVSGGSPISGTPAEVAAIINNLAYWISDNTTPFNPSLNANCDYVFDIIPPTIVCPANVDVSADANCQFVLGDYTGDATVSDNISDPADIIVTQSPAAGTVIGLGITTVTLTAEDEAGNTADCTFDVTVNDDTPPSITCPPNLTIQCDASTDPTNTGTATATDNCDLNPSISFADVVSAGACPQESSIARTWTAMDADGNSNSCVQTIIVVDTIAPLISCPPDVTIECDASTDPSNTGSATATDACDANPTINFSDVTTGASGELFMAGRNNSTLYVIDANTYAVNNSYPVTLSGFTVQGIQGMDIDPISGDYYVIIKVSGGPRRLGTLDPLTGTATDIGALPDRFSGITFASNGTLYGVTGDGASNPETLWTVNKANPGASVILTPLGNGNDGEQIDFNPDDGLIYHWSGFLPNRIMETIDPITLTITNIPLSGSTWTEATGTNYIGNGQFLVSDYNNLELYNVDIFGNSTLVGTTPSGGIRAIEGGGTGCGYVITRTWTATDACGNSSSCTQTITVVDTTPPVPPSAPADLTLDCADDVLAPVALTATDNCDGAITVSPTAQITPGTCPNDFIMVRTWTFTDDCGNTSSVSQTITVEDTTAPAPPAPPADLTLQCASDVPPPVNLTATDNCDGLITVSPTAQVIPTACLNEFIMIRTWVFSDVCGNTSSVSQTITVEDDLAPVAPAAPADLTLQCASDVPPPVDLTATDNCDGDIIVGPTAQITALNCVNEFVMVRTWTFTDTCGNSSSVNQTITVKDDLAPVAPAPPADLTLQCASDVPPPVNLTAIDNCDGLITVSPTAQVIPTACLNEFIMIRTWVFSDICGNTSSVSQTITVKDDLAPVAPSAPADLNLECAADVPPPVSLTATDNCDGDITVAPTATITPGVCVNDFTMVRTWTFTDTCGNSSSVNQTITVKDDLAPVAPAPPADLTLQCASDVPPPGPLTAIDNCDGPITAAPTATVTPGSCVNDFTMVRTWIFTDICGNTSSVSQTITVLDDTAPVAPAPPADLTLQCAEDVPPPVNLTAIDNCDGPITAAPTANVTPGSCANDFTMVRTWTFIDVCGNTSSVSQTITVFDDTPPAIFCPPDITVESEPGECVNLSVDIGQATATDNCLGTVTITNNAPSEFGFGNTLVTWTAVDQCGNTSQCVQTVTVEKIITITSVTVTPDTQQYSDLVEFEAIIDPGDCPGAGLAATKVEFYVGTQLMGTANMISDGENLVGNLTAALLEIPNDPFDASDEVGPGLKTVTAVFLNVNLNYDVSNPTTDLTIIQEDAVIDYTGQMLQATESSNSGNATVALCVNIQDIADGYRGDIRNATVSFYDRTTLPGVPILGAQDIQVSDLVIAGDSTLGTVCFDWEVDINQQAAVAYTVGIVVNNYYTADENTVITVYKPKGDFITGGGFIIPDSSEGVYASTDGLKTNFGFNVKYNKKGTKVQGRVNIIFRIEQPDGSIRTYQIKSNAKPTFGVDISDPDALIAEFTSKANLSDITDPLNPLSLGGNRTLKVELTDRGEPGVDDSIGFNLTDSSGTLLYSSNWNGTSTDELTLSGGNLLVHSGFSSAPAANPVQEPTLTIFKISSDENPFDAKASLTLETNDSSNMVTYSVYDSNNKFLYANTLAPDQKFEFGQGVKSGMYLVIVQQGNKVGQIRMIKK